jgi:single-strand DNA-binding protein
MYETMMTMTGRLATTVTRVEFKDGGIKATFRLANTERRFDRGSQQWVDGARLFLTVVCWRSLAEHVATALSVGDPVIIQGRLREREYEKDGRVHSVLEIEATSIGPDLARCTATVARRSTQSSAPAPRVDEPSNPQPTRPAGDSAEEQGQWDSGPLVPEYVDQNAQAAPEHRRDEAAVGV